MSKYDFGYEIKNGTPMEWAFSKVKPHSTVLELGPAIGTLTKKLAEAKECIVDIVEIDLESGALASKYARKAIIGDKGNLEETDWLDELNQYDKYDYIIALDVIEHLRFTDRIFEGINSLLRDDGLLLLSIPNIAHNSVLINLLNNKFEYNNLGLLDDTHVKFFTYKSLEMVFRQHGLAAVEKDYIQKLVGDNEIESHYEDIPIEVVDFLRTREYSDVYQMLYVVKKEKFLTADEQNDDSMPNALPYTYYRIELLDESKILRHSEFVNIRGKVCFQVNIEASWGERIYLDLPPRPCILKEISLLWENGEPVYVDSSNCLKISKEEVVFTSNEPSIILKRANGFSKLNISFVYLPVYNYELSRIFAQYYFDNKDYLQIIDEYRKITQKKTFVVEFLDDQKRLKYIEQIEENEEKNICVKVGTDWGGKIYVHFPARQCLLKNASFTWEDSSTAEVEDTNGIKLSDTAILFPTNDPALVFKHIDKYNELRINIEYNTIYDEYLCDNLSKLYFECKEMKRILKGDYKMHFYTSVNINYLPKARILAKSVKQYCLDSKFSLVFSDTIPQEIKVEDEPFDEIITIDQLGIPVDDLDEWIFEHSVVELCTAVKGQALVKFLEEGSEKVVYLDPDIAVFNDLRELNELMDHYDVILTPHVTIPEEENDAVRNNEICALMHGAYNFGFYAVSRTDNGLAFARWWRDRLVDFCFDDIPNGIFTDQKWGDLVPCMFEGVYILRDPGYNVSTWNISHREMGKNERGLYTVNGTLLKFYHFSGFDSGAQLAMLDMYSQGNKYLYELRNWYIERMAQEEQEKYGSYPSKYNFYDNGEKITPHERFLMRIREDLKIYFKNCNPYVVEQERSYYKWYRNEAGSSSEENDIKRLEEENRKLHEELSRLKTYSIRGKLLNIGRRIADRVNGK